MANSQRWAVQRWPEIPPDHEQEPPRGQRWRGERWEEPEDHFDEELPRTERERPIVNPYAVIALVAALLLLFPVALVFGFIAFAHPRGRLMAVAALLLGAAEVTLLAAFVILPREQVSDMYARAEDAVGDPTGTREPPSSAPVGPSATVVPVPTEHPASPTATGIDPAGVPPVARLDTACPEPALVGAAVDGSTLLCLTDPGSVTGYQWSGPYRVAARTADEGGTCSGPGTARTVTGHALVCENDTWVLWVS
ncbi:hypothetical protein [Nocardia sp. X0981]